MNYIFSAIPSHENWTAFLAGKVCKGGYEVPLYTDSEIAEDVFKKLGPYQLFSSYAPGMTGFKAIITLRVDLHLEDDIYNFVSDRTVDDSAYHGGDLDDEIAALLSLCLGIRLKAGSVTRRFSSRLDPKGIPEYGMTKVMPTLGANTHYTRIPRLEERHSVRAAIPILESLPRLSPEDATALIKVARQYQEALWVADADPSLAWVMFVSAIEAAADHGTSKKDSPVDLLKEYDQDLYRILMEGSGAELTEKVAKRLVSRMGAVRKFMDFIIAFLPGPPPLRPSREGMVSFEEPEFATTLRTIYNYRSKALHAGKPFPHPMCTLPSRSGGDNVPAERPLGLATTTQGGTWEHKDTPMHLHTFEYIVRSSLLAWWKSMVTLHSDGESGRLVRSLEQ